MNIFFFRKNKKEKLSGMSVGCQTSLICDKKLLSNLLMSNLMLNESNNSLENKAVLKNVPLKSLVKDRRGRCSRTVIFLVTSDKHTTSGLLRRL